ncbi:MAG: hypothetical protein JKX95_03000 [Bacteroidia bacterium]|nr:hypothetical protein [Bacteroidia bacterium]
MTKLLVLITFISIQLLPFSSINAQKVKIEFPSAALIEGFSSANELWPVLVDANNLYIIQNDLYILNRKNKTSPYLLYCKWENDLKEFQIRSSLRLTGDDPNSSIGIIFMGQGQSKGGFIFEINTKKQYRLSQFVHGTLNYLSGETKTNGWVKTSALKSKSDFHILEVRVANKEYDLYINNQLISSFTELTYKFGKMGLFIGAGSKAEVDYFHVYSSKEKEKEIVDSAKVFLNLMDSIGANDESAISSHANEENINDAIEPIIEESGNKFTEAEKEQNDTEDILALTEAIVKFKTQINKLQDKNEDLEKKLKLMEKIKKAIITLEKQVIESNRVNDSIRISNKELNKFKEIFEDSDNKDIVIILSKSLKKEKLRNQSLIKENKNLKSAYHSLKDSIAIIDQNLIQLALILEENNITSPFKETNTTDSTNTELSENEMPPNNLNNSGVRDDKEKKSEKAEKNANIVSTPKPEPEKVQVKKAVKRSY